MKKFLKKLLLSLILIPTLFFMFACNNAEPPVEPGTGNPGGESSQGGGSQGGGSQGGENQGGNDQGRPCCYS